MDKLSPTQRDILSQYQAISGLTDESMAIKHLEKAKWDLNQAVEYILDSNFAQDMGDEPGPSSSGSKSSSPLRSPPTMPIAVAPTSLFATVTYPVFYFLRIVYSVVRFFFNFVPGFRLLQASNPSEDARQFQQEFDQLYGRGLTFYIGSYASALDKAKKDLKFLLVILHSPDHSDTNEFCQKTLSSDMFIDYVKDKDIIVWAGNVKDVEAYKLSKTLQVTGYPFMAFIALHDNKMKIVNRFQGLVTPEVVLHHLETSIEKLMPIYADARSERASRDVGRTIRNQQDEAYELSLKADREKAQKAKEARLEQERIEREKREAEMEVERRIQTKKDRKLELAANLKPEPSAEVSAISTMNIRLPNGSRLIRKFDASDSIQLLYDFVESHNLEPFQLLNEFVIINTYPRKRLEDKSLTFVEAGLTPNATVILEEIFEDEDDE